MKEAFQRIPRLLQHSRTGKNSFKDSSGTMQSLIQKDSLQSVSDEQFTLEAKNIVRQLFSERYKKSPYYDESVPSDVRFNELFSQYTSFEVYTDIAVMNSALEEKYVNSSDIVNSSKELSAIGESFAFIRTDENNNGKIFVYVNQGNEESLLHECSHIADILLNLHEDNSGGVRALKRSKIASRIVLISIMGEVTLGLNSSITNNELAAIGMMIIGLVSSFEILASFNTYYGLPSERRARATEKRVKN